jgi:hypothetical protein
MSFDPELVKMNIVQHGAVGVNRSFYYRKAAGVVCIEIDLHTKRAIAEAWEIDGGFSSIHFNTKKDTINLDGMYDTTVSTIIEFPDHKGWEVWMFTEPGRYTARLVLCAPHVPDTSSVKGN